jgi:hypothetical protein
MMRSTVQKDLLYFRLPAIVVFTTGLVVSGWDGEANAIVRQQLIDQLI